MTLEPAPLTVRETPVDGRRLMPLYAYDGVRPRIDGTAYVHPDAVVIGDVQIGADASVWPTTVLRGDHGRITVGDRTSVQDGTVVHTTRDWPTLIGADCVVGHNAHLEGCVVEEGCLVGSMSAVLNRAVVGAGSVIAAGALVREGTQVPPNSLVVGVPGVVRPLPGTGHRERIKRAVAIYVHNAQHYPEALSPVTLEDCRRP
jgi:carbonic anhydrase/acetyltransferase-like protein (isoleucine patch superfamily)